MRRLWKVGLWSAVILLICALGVRPAETQTNLVTFEAVTFSDTATGFTAATIRPDGGPIMQSCAGKLESGQIRYRYDGTAPSATVGTLVDMGDIVTIHGLAYLSQFKGIRTGATSGVVQFHCTREP